MSIANPYATPKAQTSRKKDEGFNINLPLQQTRPWVMFLGSLGLFASFMIFSSAIWVFFQALFTGGSEVLLPVTVISGTFMLMGLIYFIPGILLVRYGLAIGAYLEKPSREGMFAALNYQKSFWKLIGIATAVILGIYLLVGVLAFMLGWASALSR